MFNRIAKSHWTGAVIALCFVVWNGFWLVGPAIGLTRADRPWYLFWGLTALVVAGFQSFFILIRENKRLQAEAKRGNRPCLAPRDYTHGPNLQFGMLVNNSEYAAYDVHIPDAPIGDSGYILHFEGTFTQVINKEEVFFATWIESTTGGSSYEGKDLHEVMRQANVHSVCFGVIYKDSSAKPIWYTDNCMVIRDVSRYRTGLGFSRIDQEVIDPPATRPELSAAECS